MASAFENRLRRTIDMAGTDGQTGPVPVMATLSGSGNRILGADIAISSPKTLLIVGDSRTQQNYNQTATAISMRWRPVVVAMMLSGWRLRIIGNAGVNGEKVSDLLLRYKGSNPGVGFGTLGNESLPAASSPGVLGLYPDSVLFNMGFNDIWGSSRSAADTFADAKTFMDAVLDAGIVLLVGSVAYASSAASGYSTAKVVQTRLYNNMLRDYCLSRPRAYYIGTSEAAAAATSTVVETAAADLRDGTIHENNRSGWKQGKTIADIINKICAPRHGLLPSINALTSSLDTGVRNLRVNPLLTGTAAISTTGFSGTAPSGIGNGNFARGGSASAVLSVEARSDGLGQDFIFDCTFTAPGESLELRDNSYHAQATAGKRYYAVAQVEISGPSGAALSAADNLRAVQLSIQATVNGTNYFVYCGENQSTDGALFESAVLPFVTPELVFPAGTLTLLRANVGIISNGAGTPRVRVSRMDLVEVE